MERLRVEEKLEVLEQLADALLHLRHQYSRLHQADVFLNSRRLTSVWAGTRGNFSQSTDCCGYARRRLGDVATCSMIDGARGGESFNREHSLQTIDGFTQLSPGSPAHGDVVLLHRRRWNRISRRWCCQTLEL